jgi:amino acid transporter
VAGGPVGHRNHHRSGEIGVDGRKLLVALWQQLGLAVPARSSAIRDRQIGPWAFAGVAVASFGGPLALAAMAAPGLAADASESAGLAMLAAVVVFTAPLAIWLRYSRHINSAGGLYAFVEAAAGRRVALAQAAIWTFSYALYIVYTTVQIVYDLLPQVIPGVGRYQTALALLIPVALALVMVSGRAATLIVLGLMAAGQLLLAGILDGVTLANISTPVSTFGAGAPAGALAKAGGQTSLLYICGSLPLFLGGELKAPARTIRRGLIGAFLVTGLVIVLAVAPLAAAPGLLRTAIPGVSVVEQFAGVGLARVIGIGIAVSTAGVILCEYLAVTRLVHAVTRWRIRPITAVIGVGMVLAAPFTLIDPNGFYDALEKPSLVALWLSQLIVFAVYPLFAIKYRQRAWPACTLSLVASAFAVYGLVTALQQASS